MSSLMNNNNEPLQISQNDTIKMKGVFQNKQAKKPMKHLIRRVTFSSMFMSRFKVWFSESQLASAFAFSMLQLHRSYCSGQLHRTFRKY